MKEKINKIINNKFLKFLWTLIKLAVWIVVILIVLVIVVQRVFDNKVSIGSYRMFTVVTGSMLPEYEIFDVIISKEVDAKELKVGDDVVYLGNKGDFEDKIVTHRIISIKNKTTGLEIQTQGIANNAPDPVISDSQLYGKVVYHPALLSSLSKVLNSSYGFYFLVFVPIVFLIFLEILDAVKRKEEKLEGEENEGETK